MIDSIFGAYSSDLPQVDIDDFVGLPVSNLPKVPADRTESVRLELAERGKSDLYFLCKVILGYDRLTPHTHLALCKFIQTCPLRRRKIHMPRGHFKTTIFTIGETIRDILNDPDIRILLVASTSRNAERFLSEIRKHFEANEFLRWLYPEVIPSDFNLVTWNNQEITVKRTTFWREPTIDTIGARGNVESRHYSIIRADDLIGRREYESETEMEKTIEWSDGLEALLIDPSYQLDVIGSKWTMSDVYAHIERFYSGDEPPQEIGPYAYIRGEIAVFSRGDKENGQPIFPERFTLRYLNRLQSRNPEFYAAQYANNPIAPGLATFREEWWKTAFREGNEVVVYEPASGRELFRRSIFDLRRFALVDPAVAKNKKKNCRNSMLMIGVAELGRRGKWIFILDSKIGHYSPTEMVDTIYGWDELWKPEFFSVEAVAYQAAIKFWLEDRAEREFLICPSIIEWLPESDVIKDQRIKGLQPFYRAGMIFAVGDHAELKDEFIFHPRAQFRDGLDSLAQGPAYWGGVLDEEVESKSRRREAALLAGLDQTGYGFDITLARQSADWDEEEWLKSFDNTGYGQQPQQRVHWA